MHFSDGKASKKKPKKVDQRTRDAYGKERVDHKDGRWEGN